MKSSALASTSSSYPSDAVSLFFSSVDFSLADFVIFSPGFTTTPPTLSDLLLLTKCSWPGSAISSSDSSVSVSGSRVVESDRYRTDIDLSRSRREGVLTIWVGGSGLSCSSDSSVSVSGSGVVESDRYRTDIDLSRSRREGVLAIWVVGSGLTCSGSECWRVGYSESTGGSGLLGWSNLKSEKLKELARCNTEGARNSCWCCSCWCGFLWEVKREVRKMVMMVRLTTTKSEEGVNQLAMKAHIVLIAHFFSALLWPWF